MSTINVKRSCYASWLPPKTARLTVGTVIQKIWYDIFVDCNYVNTRWQYYGKNLHTNNTYNNTNNNRTTQITTNLKECRPCPVFASFTLAFALQLRWEVTNFPFKSECFYTWHMYNSQTEFFSLTCFRVWSPYLAPLAANDVQCSVLKQ